MSACRNPLQTHRSPMAGAGRIMPMLFLCLLVVGAGFHSAQARPRGSRIGIGIGAGILGAIILNEAAPSERASRDRYDEEEPYYEERERPSRRWKRSRAEDRRYSAGPRQERAAKARKNRSAGKSKPPKSKAPDTEAAAAKPADETVAPGTSETAATSQRPPEPRELTGTQGRNAAAPDTSYLPQADRKATATQIVSTAAEIKSAQEHLKYLGYDVPAATGSVDARTKIAITEFQQSIGAKGTGALTYDQLQTLLAKAAGQTAKTR